MSVGLVNPKLSNVKKRDGSVVKFDREQITDAIFAAAKSVGGHDRDVASGITNVVVRELDYKYSDDDLPSVEDVQDLVEKILIETGHAKTAKSYILYREKKKELRQKQSELLDGLEITDEDKRINLSDNALRVLRERYLIKDEDGNLIETPAGLFRRVAKNIAAVDETYNESSSESEEAFYKVMTNLEFLPNSPTLMNAGSVLQQLSACFVLPVGDSMEEIFDSVKHAALIHKSGGGTGFAFSRLRPKNDLVRSTKGVSSGPISFMKVFDAATNVIKQGGKRRGANMGVLRIDHPDILDFISCKENNADLNNFNISVGLTEEFMKAAKEGKDYDLLNPRTLEPISKLNAGMVFEQIVTSAWKNGEPGILFLDRINNDNPTPHIGEMEATNPCGEQPLLPYEACNLGSINLSKFLKEDGKFDYNHLKEVVGISIHFLDNVVDASNFPVDLITQNVRANRKIGLGVMGFADLLFKLKIPYNSDEAVEKARELMKFVNDAAREKSVEIAKRRGSFPNYKGSMYDDGVLTHMRNATRTTIAPTGTLSMIADCSCGVEPVFALSYIKRVMDGQELVYGNKYLEEELKVRGLYSQKLMQKIAKSGTLHDIDEIPEDMKKVFVVAHDITPKDHIMMQSGFQENCDNAVSKTVNFPHTATIKDVEDVYQLAYESKCKGVTIYRDGSRDMQVFEVKKTSEPKKDVSISVEQVKIETPKEKVVVENKVDENKKEYVESGEECPECKTKMYMSEGCAMCPSCGFSLCHMG